MKYVRLRILAALLCTSMNIPAHAQMDGTHPVIVLHNMGAGPNEIVYCKPDQFTASDKYFLFTPINGDMAAQDYYYVNGTYDLLPAIKNPPPPPPTPNVPGLVQA